MYYKQEIGKNGENKVCKYLEKKGYKILDKNFSCKIGEIDIIALEKEQIIFIEVKTRTNCNYGLPSEAVNKKKIKNIYRTAEFYMATRNLYCIDTRIDVIEVYYDNGKPKINHIEQVV